MNIGPNIGRNIVTRNRKSATTEGKRRIFQLPRSGREWLGTVAAGRGNERRTLTFRLGTDKTEAGRKWDRFHRAAGRKWQKTPEIFLAAVREFFPDRGADAERFLAKTPKERKEIGTVRKCCTIGEIAAVYQRDAALIGLKPKSIRQNLNYFYRLLRICHARRKGLTVKDARGKISYPGTYKEIDELSADVLTAALIGEYTDAIMGDAEGPEEIAAAQRLCNDSIRQAQIFSKRALKVFEQKGLALPDLSGFRAERRQFAASIEPYQLPDEGTILAAVHLAQSPDLAEETRHYLALALFAGLRKAEIEAAKWNWLISRDGAPFLRVGDKTFTPKAKRKRDVDLPPSFFSYLKGKENPNDSAAPIISDTKTYGRALAEARKVFPKSDSPIHDLRRLAGSIVKSLHKSTTKAQLWLGHSSVSVTELYYTDNTFVSQRIIREWQNAFSPTRNLARALAAWRAEEREKGAAEGFTDELIENHIAQIEAEMAAGGDMPPEIRAYLTTKET